MVQRGGGRIVGSKGLEGEEAGKEARAGSRRITGARTGARVSTTQPASTGGGLGARAQPGRPSQGGNCLELEELEPGRPARGPQIPWGPQILTGGDNPLVKWPGGWKGARGWRGSACGQRSLRNLFPLLWAYVWASEAAPGSRRPVWEQRAQGAGSNTGGKGPRLVVGFCVGVRLHRGSGLSEGERNSRTQEMQMLGSGGDRAQTW